MAPRQPQPDGEEADRFAGLQPATKKWLSDLREQDIREMKEAARWYGSAKTVGRFFRWLGLTVLIALGAGAAFGDHIANVWKFLFPGHP